MGKRYIIVNYNERIKGNKHEAARRKKVDKLAKH